MAKKTKKSVDQSKNKDFEEEDLDEEEEDLEESSEDLEDEDDDQGDEDDSPQAGKGKASKKGKKAAKDEDEEEDEEEEDEEGDEEEEEEEVVDFIPKDASPEVRKALKKANDRMKSAFNKKMTEVDKSSKGKISVSSFEELLDNPKFMEWAQGQMANAGVSGNGVTGDVTKLSAEEAIKHWARMSPGQRTAYFTKLQPVERQLFRLQLQVAQMQQSNLANRETDLDGKALAAYGDNYSAIRDQVVKLRREVPYLTHEEAFKILDYIAHGKRMYKMGKLKGKKNVKKIKGLPRSEAGVGGKGKSKKQAKTVREAFEQAEEEEGEE